MSDNTNENNNPPPPPNPELVKKEKLIALVQALHPDITVQPKADRAALIVPKDQWPVIALKLKVNEAFQFDMLCDHAAVDWPKDQIIELVYQLYSTSLKHYLMICVQIPRAEPKAESVSSIWPIAEWQEREVYDLFGVQYRNHPDLRRIFLEDDWKGHPLLKDYQDDFMLERPW